MNGSISTSTKDKCAGGTLWKHLRCRKKRRKRYDSYEKCGQIPNRTLIDERPQVVSERSRLVNQFSGALIEGKEIRDPAGGERKRGR